MKKLAMLALVAAGVTAGNAVPTFAQTQPRYYPRRGQYSYPAQPYRNFAPPNRNFAPPTFAPQSRIVNDGRGNQFLHVQRFNSVWDARRGRWTVQATHEVTPHGPTGGNVRPMASAKGTHQIGQPGSSAINPTGQPMHVESFNAKGTNQIGQGANQNTGQPLPPLAPASALGSNSVGQPISQPAPAVAFGSNALGQPMVGQSLIGQPVTGQLTTNQPLVGQPGIAINQPLVPPAPVGEPQPLYAPNLGIFYLPVVYDNGTFGAKLTSAPVAGKPASALPIDTDDVIFLFENQRFKTLDDLLNRVGQTTVGYLDSATNTSQSATITIPPQ
jgi:hypothetical protein